VYLTYSQGHTEGMEREAEEYFDSKFNREARYQVASFHPPSFSFSFSSSSFLFST